ncbi:MAG TPA: hypothetical protein PLB45_01840 [Bacilli bacterium]|nr:hypothetical protein [Bacilli bacterium]HQC83601.1 hypothetical protein [Bacilli bacterium]
MKKTDKKDKVEKNEEKKSYDASSIVKKVLSFIFWVVIIILAFVWIFDFVQVRQSNNAKFCLSNNTIQENNVTITECVGLGYHVYRYYYQGNNYKTEFSPMFISWSKDDYMSQSN